jgi:hypothetical protein
MDSSFILFSCSVTYYKGFLISISQLENQLRLHEPQRRFRRIDL